MWPLTLWLWVQWIMCLELLPFAAGWSPLPAANLFARAPRPFPVGVSYCYLRVRKSFQRHKLSLAANRKEIKLTEGKKTQSHWESESPSYMQALSCGTGGTRGLLLAPMLGSDVESWESITLMSYLIPEDR